jgi:hypothetical protein
VVVGTGGIEVLVVVVVGTTPGMMTWVPGGRVVVAGFGG